MGAIKQGNVEALQSALEAGINPDACVGQVLIDAGADLNRRNRQGKTALALAMDDKKQAIAQLLRTADATE